MMPGSLATVLDARATVSFSEREAGDRARDRLDWREAAGLYRRHLASHPDDGAIWMQFGHASKEIGDFDAAEAAYRTAQRLRPDDADVPLQIGHLMKLGGRTREAADAYASALTRVPSSDAYGELVGLGRSALADRLVATKATSGCSTLYLQINDLLNFLRVHRAPSGIQRVQLGIVECCLDEGSRPAGERVEFVVTRPNDARIWKASRNCLMALVGHLGDVEVDQRRLTSSVDEVIATASLVRPGRHDGMVVLGAFWDRPDNAALLNTLRKRGVSIGVYIYDIIPISHPEYCNSQLVADFTADFCEMLSLVDFALAISEFTAAQVRQFLDANGRPALPMAVVPLAHTLSGQDGLNPADTGDEPDWPDSIAHLRGRDFVLCIGTIEPRKNHRYLYDVWKALKAEGLDMPDLVFVGRRGWNMDDFFTQMRNSDWLGGSITVVHDLSDRGVATLYRSCLMTTFPSIVEGWGLPVGESLSYGRLCVSSNTSSMREVGGDHVLYIDPFNLRDGIGTFRDLVSHRGKIADWEGRIRSDFSPRTWTDVSKGVLASASRLRSEVRRADGEAVAELPPGIFLNVGRFVRGAKVGPLHEYFALERMALAESFYRPEERGAWMKGGAGVIRFRTALPPGLPVVCYMVVKGAPHIEGGDVSVSGSIAPIVFRPLQANSVEILRLKGTVGDSGEMHLKLKFHGKYCQHQTDERDFCLALVGFGYADAGDALARAELLEGCLVDHADLRRP